MSSDNEPASGAAIPAEFRRRGARHSASWAFYGSFWATLMGQGPFVIRQLGGSALQCLLPNLGQGAVMLPALLWVPLVRRRNPVRLTGLLLALSGCVAMTIWWAHDLWPVSLLLTATLMVGTVHRPALGVALEQVYPRQWRGKLMSLPTAVDMLMRALVLVVVGRLLTRNLAAYRWTFPAAGLGMVVGGVLFRGVHGGSSRRSRGVVRSGGVVAEAAATLARSLRNAPLLLFLLGYFLATCGGVLFGNALPIFGTDDLGLTPQQWGVCVALPLLLTLPSFRFWGRFMDRFGAPATMVVTWSAICILSGAVVVVRGYGPLLAIMAARGLFMAGNILAFFPIVMHFTDSADTAPAMGLHSSLWGLRWIAMPLIVVLVVDRRLFPVRLVFLASLALTAAGVAVMAAVWCRERRTGVAPAP
jgi:Na+/melibiose symporter-like transporter